MSILSHALRVSRAPVAAFTAVGLTWGCVAAMAPVLKARIGVDDAAFGLLLLGTAVGLSSTLYIAPRWDRMMGRLALPLGTLLLAGAVLLPVAAVTVPLFFVALMLMGATSGLTDVVMNARVSEVEARTGRSLMNVNHAMFSVAYAISALLTGAMREAGWGPEAIFPVTAALILVTAPFQRMEVASVPEDPTVDSRLPIGVVAICAGMVLIGFMAEATVESWSALHVERTLGGGAAEGCVRAGHARHHHGDRAVLGAGGGCAALGALGDPHCHRARGGGRAGGRGCPDARRRLSGLRAPGFWASR